MYGASPPDHVAVSAVLCPAETVLGDACNCEEIEGIVVVGFVVVEVVVDTDVVVVVGCDTLTNIGPDCELSPDEPATIKQ